MKEKLIKLYILFITFFKVGLFTFGGGYAMIPIIQKEIVEKKKWMKENEILDILAISESTPGPISVNAATYIGYKQAHIIGAIISTLGLVLPSFLIILGISFVYKEVMAIPLVNAAFKGIKVAVILLLVNAFMKLSKGIKKDLITILIFLITLIFMLCLSFFVIDIPFVSIMLIASGLIIGIIYEVITKENKK